MAYCIHCGNKLGDNVNFCSSCGKRAIDPIKFEETKDKKQ